MRFTIKVDHEWKVTITCPKLGEGFPLTRSMERSANKEFPIPPKGKEDSPASGESHYNLCVEDETRPAGKKTALAEANEAIRTLLNSGICLADQDLPERFGRYLFDTLIGRNNWKVIKEAAKGVESAELALSWPADENELNCLPWELMCAEGKGEFLAKEFAITRLVAETSSDDYVPRQLNFPPKILFVTGTDLTDSDIRPGAEYMGLLRLLKEDKSEVRVHSRELQSTTTDRLKKVMAVFEPDVVFFACHGDIDNHGNYYLKLPNPETETDQCYAKDLKKLLEPIPPIVVLSACYSGGVLHGAHESAPLAAELVKKGIPIVIGMAGEISNPACRLFSRRFGQALLQGEPIVDATAEGRRAAWVDGPACNSYDWARPTVFLSEKVENTYKVNLKGRERANKIEELIKAYAVRKQNQPVFTGRRIFIEHFEVLLDEKPNFQVLTIITDKKIPGVGRSRLLEEFTMQALREGHIPCPSIVYDDETYEGPKDIINLGTTILNAIRKARSAFGLPSIIGRRTVAGTILPPSQMFLLEKGKGNLNDLMNQEDLDDGIKEELAVNKKITWEAVRLALREDLEALREEAMASEKYAEVISKKSKVLILLDTLYKYDGNVLRDLFNMLGGTGFGKGEGKEVPVVLVYSKGSPQDDTFKTCVENISTFGKLLTLTEFQENEDLLAYEWVLMHPFDSTILDDISPYAWIMDYRMKDDIVTKYKVKFRKYLKNPGDFRNPNLWAWALNATQEEFLKPADDEAMLKKMQNRGNPGANGTVSDHR